MKLLKTKIFISLFILFTSFSLFSQAPDTVWMKVYEGNFESILQTSDDGYIIVGPTASYWEEDSDFYIIKISSYGDSMWAQTYGDTGHDEPSYVLQTKNGGYVIVGTMNVFRNPSAILIKVDDAGNIVWTKNYGTLRNGKLVQQTGDGGYAVFGTERADSSGNSRIYMIKTDKNGNELWHKNIGSKSSSCGESIIETDDGGFIVVGSMDFSGNSNFEDVLIKLDINGNMKGLITKNRAEHESAIHFNHFDQTYDGGLIIAGDKFSKEDGAFDMLIIRTDSLGNTIWSKTFGGNERDECNGIRQTSDSGFIAVGTSASFSKSEYTIDVFSKLDVLLLKLDKEGNTLWGKTYGGDSCDVGESIQNISGGGYIVAGWTKSFGRGGTRIMILKIDSEGNNPYCTSTLGKTYSFYNDSFAIYADVITLTKKYLNEITEGSLDTMLEYYEFPLIYYYEVKSATQDLVKRNVEEFFENMIQKETSVISCNIMEANQSNNILKIELVYEYNFSNSIGEIFSGTRAITITWKKVDGDWKIIAETEKDTKW